MPIVHLGRRGILGAALLAMGGMARAAGVELHVLTSGGLTAAYRILGPEFEKATGHRLVTAQGASMGTAPDAIPQRLARNEPADVLLLAANGLDALIASGKAVAGSRV
ncbi:MAG: ABC transporter substrate-binding protein, partial [Acetobacteraceae bacterium]